MGEGKGRAVPPAGSPYAALPFFLCCLSVSVPSLLPYFAYVTLIREVGAISCNRYISDTDMWWIYPGSIRTK